MEILGIGIGVKKVVLLRSATHTQKRKHHFWLLLSGCDYPKESAVPEVHGNQEWEWETPVKGANGIFKHSKSSNQLATTTNYYPDPGLLTKPALLESAFAVHCTVHLSVVAAVL